MKLTIVQFAKEIGFFYFRKIVKPVETEVGISKNNLLTIQTCPFYTIYAASMDNTSSSLQLMVFADKV